MKLPACRSLLGVTLAFWAIAGCGRIPTSCGAKTSEAVLAQAGTVRLLRSGGVGTGVVVASPHMPVIIPVVNVYDQVWIDLSGRRLDVGAKELPVPEGASVEMEVDEKGERVAISVNGSPSRLIFVPRSVSSSAVVDPDPLPASPLDWGSAPILESRLPALFEAAEHRSFIVDEAFAIGGDAKVAQLLADTAARAPDADFHWTHAYERLAPEARGPVQRALGVLVRADAPPDAAVRRAVAHASAKDLALPASRLAPLLRREELDEPTRASLLVLSAREPGVDALACELLKKQVRGPLSSGALLALADSALACPAAAEVLFTYRCMVYEPGEAVCDPKKSRGEVEAALESAPRTPAYGWPDTGNAAFWYACLKGKVSPGVMKSWRRRGYDIDAVRELWWGESVAQEAACDAPPNATEHVFHGHPFLIDDARKRVLPADAGTPP